MKMEKGPEKLQTAYKTVMDDHLPKVIIMSCDFDGDGENVRNLRYEKVTWRVFDPNEGMEVEKGLRYGENPGQEAALYKLVNGNLSFGDVETIQPGRWLASDVELRQSGKHPGKTNITDADNALNILRYFTDEYCVAIMKHNNPCGVAIGSSLVEAYDKADMADRIAAFGGSIALNRECDIETAKEIVKRYAEVVVAPEFADGVMDIFAAKKNLRVMKIGNMDRLKSYVGARVLDFKSLMDGGLVVQASYVPEAVTLEDIKALPLGYQNNVKKRDGADFKIENTPSEQQYRDMWFGWLVESGITSNSVIYVKDGVTVGIGTGEQDRVGVAEIARDKAYTKLEDNLCFERTGISFNDLTAAVKKEQPIGHMSLSELQDIVEEVGEATIMMSGNLVGSTMVSDAFFPFRDGVDVGLEEGIGAIIQPGGSERDFESIEACNDAEVPMVYTGQRSFKH